MPNSNLETGPSHPGSTLPTYSTHNNEKDARRRHRLSEESEGRRRCIEADIESLARNLHTPISGGDLDPHSPTFDAKRWVRSVTDLWGLDDNDTNTRKGTRTTTARKLGVAFRDLTVSGKDSTAPKHQQSAGGVVWDMVPWLARRLLVLGGAHHAKQQQPKDKDTTILRDFEGVLEDGELLLVLGPPGSGCSTLLKTIAGETTGLRVSPGAEVNFRGIRTQYVRTRFRGDVLYNAERDVHLAHLTVGETLRFAAAARSPRTPPPGLTRAQMADLSRDVVMAVLGIAHTADTRVGDDMVRGVSGGERKRVSIAEATLAGARLQCWDNSTRGLDSANAVNFCECLRGQADLLGISAAVAIYQAPQSAYELFDRVTVLYEGRQIYFGPTSEAKAYFQELGFHCPNRQTTPDFLTSMTSPNQRRILPGFESRAPRTPDEFAMRWQASRQRQDLVAELADYELKHPADERLVEFQQSRHAEQAKSQPLRSPYSTSYAAQVGLNLWRGWRRLLADPAYTIASLLFQVVMALMLGSMFFRLREDASTFYYRGGILFFSLLFNAFASQLEVLTVYAERPVVEKQHKYAFYSLSTQAIASYVIDLPYKTANMFVFNLVVYFMTRLRPDAGSFFFFSLVTYLTTLVMSCLYRTLAYLTRTPAQAMVPSALLSIGLIIYTGFCIPPAYLPGWSEWMYHVNPLSYAFEALMANEFSGRQFPCAANMVPQGPGYDDLAPASRICSVVGARAGENTVSGDAYIQMSFGYHNENKWRNVGILAAYLVGLFAAYMAAAEFSTPPKGRGEFLIFRRGAVPEGHVEDAESSSSSSSSTSTVVVQIQDDEQSKAPEEEGVGVLGKGNDTSVFHWEDLCYDVHVKGQERRRLLDHVDGWVKPGKSTALMVSSRCLGGRQDHPARRLGHPGHDGGGERRHPHRRAPHGRRVVPAPRRLRAAAGPAPRDGDGARGARVQRPAAAAPSTPRAEKLRYVDEVIDMLGMREFAGAVVGVPGEGGLNVEQRKRLTIGVELAARPELLVFLDEPTSGLDAQTSWAICDLIERLTRSGQAVLCTIHQPSAILFQRFDRLLLLSSGGKTAYFGGLGDESRTLIEYLERNGAPKCPDTANPAEWMLEVIQSPTDGTQGIDWFATWRESPEYQAVKSELSRLRNLSAGPGATSMPNTRNDDPSLRREFVTPFWSQLWEVLLRTAKHYWRSPTYIWSKILMVGLSSLYIGFSFRAQNSLQGLQNQLYAIFMFFVLFGNLNEQIMPTFVPLRALYEARERPSKMYQWTSFLLSNILVEAFYNCLMAMLAYLCWYYPVGFVQNTSSATDAAERGAQVFLFLLQYMLFTSTFSHLAIAGVETAETAGVLASLLWLLCISFSGVSVRPLDLPRFWEFMYRVSPCNYLISGIMSASLTGSPVVCDPAEILHMQVPTNQTTCGDFLDPFVASHGGTVLNPNQTGLTGGDLCAYCPVATTDDYLAGFQIAYADAWPNFALLWSYIVANVVLTFVVYRLFRVPKANALKRAQA
ncbi:ABC transporter [Apiospora saccharicola]|uniref:ABC transporter n=1 Tax=Apiospora saccharicola TaxID=335842 RepID=A0ABR1UJU8_9PEZI